MLARWRTLALPLGLLVVIATPARAGEDLPAAEAPAPVEPSVAPPTPTPPEDRPAPPAAAAAPAATANDDAKPCQIAVLDLVPRGLPASDKNLPQFLAEMMAAEVADASGCQVIGQADVKSMVDFEASRASCGEADESCLAALGQALGVERIVAGSIGMLGAQYVMAVRLVDINRAVVEKRAEEVSTTTEELRPAAKRVARALFDKPVAPEPPLEIDMLLVGGVGLAVVGGAVAVYGVLTAVEADTRLGDAKATDKDAAYDQGRLGVTVTSLGAIALAGGVALSVISFLE